MLERGADLAVVKAAKCYGLYPNARSGQTVFGPNGKDISHLTFCGCPEQQRVEVR